MPLGSARLTLFAKPTVAAEAEVIRKKVGVSASGNAQVDTAQSKFGGASALFDGSDSLNIDPSRLSFGTNDFTIEGFFRFNVLAADDVILDCRNANDDPGRINIQLTNSTTLRFRIGTGSVINATHGMSTGTWYHIAFVRNNGTITIYVNGVSKGTVFANVEITSDNFILGNYFGGGTFGIDGHIDELRVSNTARYTAGFTPSTTPFVNDDNTLLLLHMNGTDGSTFFEDDNGVRAQVGVTAQGDAQIDTAESKFGGASGLFDGTGDHLQFPQENFTPHSLDEYTIEGWFYTTNLSDENIIWSDRAAGIVGHSFWVNTNGTIRLLGWNANVLVLDYTTTGTAVTTNTWHHIAITKNSSDLYTVWLNGSSIGSVTDTSTISQGGVHRIGQESTDREWVGNIDEFRISDTARYTTGFTPSTAPFVNDSNTLLLLHMDGTDGDTDFRDDNGVGRSAIGVSAIGDAQIDTAQSKFGGTSFLGDGTGDYLEVTNNGQFDFGTGDFTIEWFQYLTSLDRFSIDMRGGTNGSNILIYSFPTDGSAADLYLYVNSANRISASGVISANVWQHIALVRNSGTTRLYVDGTQAGSDYSDSTNYDNADMLIWENSLSAGNYTPPGHIDEFRMSDSARYTGAFTAPTEPFQNDANTLLLLHMDGTDGSTVFIDDNGKQA